MVTNIYLLEGMFQKQILIFSNQHFLIHNTLPFSNPNYVVQSITHNYIESIQTNNRDTFHPSDHISLTFFFRCDFADPSPLHSWDVYTSTLQSEEL